MTAANSGFPYFDFLPLRSSRRGCFRPAASRRRCSALSGGHSLPGLDPGPVRCPWCGGRRACLGWGRRSLRPWLWRRGFLGRGAVLGSIPLTSLFLFQKALYSTLDPPRSANSRILDPVAAVVIGLPTLGSIPELAPQAFCPIVQSTADKLFGRRFDFLFYTFFNCAFFLDFLDVLSPPGTRNRAADAALFPIFSRCILLG